MPENRPGGQEQKRGWGDYTAINYSQQQRQRREPRLRMRSKGHTREFASTPPCAGAWLSPPAVLRRTVNGFQHSASRECARNPRVRITMRRVARCQTRALGGIIPPVGKKHACAEVRHEGWASARRGHAPCRERRRLGGVIQAQAQCGVCLPD